MSSIMSKIALEKPWLSRRPTATSSVSANDLKTGEPHTYRSDLLPIAQ